MTALTRLLLWVAAGTLSGPLLESPLGAQEARPPVDRPILDRSPSEWTAAEPGRWSGWDAGSSPPEAVLPYLRRAIDAYGRDDMRGTLEALFELLATSPDYPTALHQAGTIYFRLQRYGDTITALERYLLVAPHRAGDTRYLAHAYYSLGRYGDARGHYLKVLAARPNSVEARRGLGLALMRLGDSEGALRELRRVLELDPSHASAATWIAQVLFERDQVKEARDAARLARELDPFDPRGWYLSSQILFALEQDDAGEAAERRFEQLSHIAEEVRASEGRLLFDPLQPVEHRRVIALHRVAGDARAVEKALRRWLRSMPESLEGWEALVRFYTEAGDAVRRQEAERELARLTREQRR